MIFTLSDEAPSALAILKFDDQLKVAMSKQQNNGRINLILYQ